MKFGLRPEVVSLWGRESLLDDFGRVSGLAPIDWPGGGSGTECLINDIDLKALVEEERGPATATIRLVKPILVEGQ